MKEETFDKWWSRFTIVGYVFGILLIGFCFLEFFGVTHLTFIGGLK